MTPEPEPIRLVTLAELDAMPRTPGICAYCLRDTMVYVLILFTCRKCVLDDMEKHGEKEAQPYACRCGSRCKTPQELVEHLEVRNTSHGPDSPEARAALVCYGTSWHVRETTET